MRGMGETLTRFANLREADLMDTWVSLQAADALCGACPRLRRLCLIRTPAVASLLSQVRGVGGPGRATACSANRTVRRVVQSDGPAHTRTRTYTHSLLPSPPLPSPPFPSRPSCWISRVRCCAR
jgi:hypothetical protein